MNTIFKTFKHGGRQFLAVPNGNPGREITVIDELGYNYGSFMDLNSFEKWRKRGDATALCVCRIAVTDRAAIPAEMPKETPKINTAEPFDPKAAKESPDKILNANDFAAQ